MIKVLENLGMKGIYLHIIKAIYNKFTRDIFLNGEKHKLILIKLGRRQGYSLFPVPFK